MALQPKRLERFTQHSITPNQSPLSAEGALKYEGTPYAMDVALCLRLFVSDEIDRQLERIDNLLGRERTYESSQDDGGDE